MEKNSLDPELLEIMWGVYNRWSGHELAEVIAHIRSELTERERRQQIEDEIHRLAQERDS